MGIVLLASLGLVACSTMEKQTETPVENEQTENLPPIVSIDAPTSGATVVENTSVLLSGSISDPEDAIGDLSPTWFVGERIVCAAAVADPSGSISCEATVLLGDEEVSLVVADPNGNTTTAAVEITVLAEEEPPPQTPVLTFQVDMGSYQGGVTVGNSVQGWDTAGTIQLTDADSNGVFTGQMELEPGTTMEYKFIRGYDGNGEWETVPVECGLQTGAYVNRVVTMPSVDYVLPVVSFSGCENDTVDDTICGSAPGRSVPITVDGYRIKDGDIPLHFKGVAWSPVPLGQAPWSGGSDFAGTVVEDSQLMADAGINLVRTYGPILDTSVLDTFWSHGIYVLMTVYYGYDDTPESAVDNICAVKDHPAIVGWVAGNEWNYDQSIASQSEIKATLQAMAANDATRPVSTIYGGIPDSTVYADLEVVEIWGTNIYYGASFGSLFNDWQALSDKPMYLAEYGSDAWNGTTNQEDQQMQSDIVAQLTQEIYDNTSVNGSGICSGGVVFEFNDEWWKYNGGSTWEHDTVNSWENYAYSDPNMQEEWWGLVDIYRQPRIAYYTFADMIAPTAE